MDRSLKIALIGHGRFGKKYFKEIKKLKKFNLVVVFVKSKIIRKSFVKFSVDKISKYNLDGAIIATPPKTHHAYFRLGLLVTCSPKTLVNTPTINSHCTQYQRHAQTPARTTDYNIVAATTTTSHQLTPHGTTCNATKGTPIYPLMTQPQNIAALVATENVTGHGT
jgi:hypothetical protein